MWNIDLNTYNDSINQIDGKEINYDNFGVILRKTSEAVTFLRKCRKDFESERKTRKQNYIILKTESEKNEIKTSVSLTNKELLLVTLIIENILGNRISGMLGGQQLIKSFAEYDLVPLKDILHKFENAKGYTEIPQVSEKVKKFLGLGFESAKKTGVKIVKTCLDSFYKDSCINKNALERGVCFLKLLSFQQTEQMIKYYTTGKTDKAKYMMSDITRLNNVINMLDLKFFSKYGYYPGEKVTNNE